MVSCLVLAAKETQLTPNVMKKKKSLAGNENSQATGQPQRSPVPTLKAQQLSDLLKKSLPTQGPRDEIFFIHPEFICLFFSPYKAWN